MARFRPPTGWPSVDEGAGNLKSRQEFLWSVRVYYEDTDSGGVVYHSNYLKFMERARTEWLREINVDQVELLDREGVVFAVYAAELAFLRPSRLDDLLNISVAVVSLRKASMSIEQSVCLLDKEPKVVCNGLVKIACVDAITLSPKPIPKKTMELIREY